MVAEFSPGDRILEESRDDWREWDGRPICEDKADVDVRSLEDLRK